MSASEALMGSTLAWFQSSIQTACSGRAVVARLIGLLLGNLGQRPMHRAPSTAGGCNAEAGRRYLLESRALDPERQRIRWAG
jgi:hypothetical protein